MQSTRCVPQYISYQYNAVTKREKSEGELFYLSYALRTCIKSFDYF